MIVEFATSIQKVALDDSIIARRCHAGDSFNSDSIDSATQALKYLRDVGMAGTDEEE
jgi:hypothetical protein